MALIRNIAIMISLIVVVTLPRGANILCKQGYVIGKRKEQHLIVILRSCHCKIKHKALNP